MLREKLAHSHQAQIRKVRPSIGVAVGESGKLNEMLPAVKRQRDEPFIQHRENDGRALEVKCGLPEDRLARQQRLSDVGRDLHCPGVMFVVGVCERDQESRSGDAFTGARTLYASKDPARAEWCPRVA